MVNDIIVAIAEQLRTKYSENDYKVYTEPVEQGFDEPCFFIKLISQSQQHMLSERYKRDNAFTIHYFNGDSEKNATCHEVEDCLYDILELITVDGQLCRGIRLNSRIEDGVLMFFVSYNAFILKKKEPDEYMKEVDVDAKAKGK